MNSIKNQSIIMTPELAEICGIHAGDGYLRIRGNSCELDISGNVEEKEYYDNHVLDLFDREFSLKVKARFFPSRRTYGIRLYDKALVHTLISLGFPNGKKTSIVQIPKKILRSKDEKIICSFLRGYFDTDGCLTFDRKIYNSDSFKVRYNYYPRIMLTTCSENLSWNLVQLLGKLGFMVRTYVTKPRKETESLKYRLQLTGNNVLELWMDKIGSKNPTKISRYKIWKKYGFCPPNTTYDERIRILNGELNPKSFYYGPVA